VAYKKVFARDIIVQLLTILYMLIDPIVHDAKIRLPLNLSISMMPHQFRYDPYQKESYYQLIYPAFAPEYQN